MAIVNFEKIEQILGVDIDEIGFPNDMTACLKRENISTVGDLLRMDYDKLEYLESIGLLSIEKIKECLNAYSEGSNEMPDRKEEESEQARLEELLNTSILDLDVGNKTYYALRFARLDTIGQIITQDRPSLRKVSKRINDLMLEDIDESIRVFAKGHDCMEEMLAFPFFDEITNVEAVKSDLEETDTSNSLDQEEVARCVEAILLKRKLQKRPWITISAIMETLGKDYPEISGIVSAGMVRDILMDAEWAEKDDFYYRYSKEFNDAPDVANTDSEEGSYIAKAEKDIEDADLEHKIEVSNEWTDERLEEKYREKYYLTKELLKSVCDKDQTWYTATEICTMLSERFPAVMKGKMYSIISRVLKNASWADASEDGLRFRWKIEEKVDEHADEDEAYAAFDAEQDEAGPVDTAEEDDGWHKLESNESSENLVMIGRNPVENLGLSETVTNNLKNNNINTIGDIFALGKSDLFRICNSRKAQYQKIMTILKEIVDYMEDPEIFSGVKLFESSDPFETEETVQEEEVKEAQEKETEAIEEAVESRNVIPDIVEKINTICKERFEKGRVFSTALTIYDELKLASPDLISEIKYAELKELLDKIEWLNFDRIGYRYIPKLDSLAHDGEEKPNETDAALETIEDRQSETAIESTPSSIDLNIADVETVENETKEEAGSIDSTDTNAVEEEIENEEKKDESIGLLNSYRSSYDPLNAHRRDLTVNYRTYHALRLSELDTVRDIISLDRKTLKREYPRIDDEMIEDIENAVLKLVSNYDYEEETKKYPFFTCEKAELMEPAEQDAEYDDEAAAETDDEAISENDYVVNEPAAEPMEAGVIAGSDLETPALEYENDESVIEDNTEPEDDHFDEVVQDAVADEAEADISDEEPVQDDASMSASEDEINNYEQIAEEELEGSAIEDTSYEDEEAVDKTDSLPSSKGLVKVDEATFERIKDVAVGDLGLSNRARNCLLRAKLSTVGMVLERTRDELAMIQNMGQGSLDDITTCIVRLISGDIAVIEQPADTSSEQTPALIRKYILDVDDDRFDNIPIEELGLSVRAHNCLRNGDIEMIGQLREITEDELLGIRGMGRGSLDEIISAVEAFAEKPSFKYASLENSGAFGDEFYSSEEFSSLVEDKVRELFLSKEKNSQTFFDIWNYLGMTIPESVITREIERLVGKGILSQSDADYHYEFISIVDAIKVLPTKYQNILSLKLQGLKYEEIAGRYGATRSRVQQLAARGMAAVIKGAKNIEPVGRVKEDDDKDLFQTYNISLSEWVTELKKPEHAYRYLAMRYRKGETKLPGAKQEDPRKAPRASRTKEAEVAPGTIDDFLDYYKSLAGVQKAVLLYSDEEQYVKDLKRLTKRINREIKNKKYISDIRITDTEYAMLRGYLHYAVKLLNKTGSAPDEAVFVTAVTNVAERVYDGNLWGNFFKEIGLKQTQTLQGNIGTKYVEILGSLELLKDEEDRFFQSVLMHCFVSNNFANAYFEFLFNFYRIDLDRDLDRLDRETMRDLMDSICSEENVGRTHMLVQHIGQAMAANRRGATIRIRNHMKLLDRFFWDDSFEINTTHRLNNMMQSWARSSKEVIGEMEAFSTGRRRGRKRFASPYIAYDEESMSCVLAIPSQSIKRFEADEIYWKVSGSINEELGVDLAESVIGYKVLESSWDIPMEKALDSMQLELMTSDGEVIKKFQIRSADVRFFDSEGYPVNSKGIKVGEVVSISREDAPVRSSALYDTQVIDGMLLSSFHFEFEDILHLPDGHVVIVGKPEITNSIAGKGRIEGAVCRFDDREYDLYGKLPYLVLRMKADKFPGTAVMINGKRYRLSDLDFESFSLDDRTDDKGYYIDLNNYLEQKNDVYRIAVDIPGGSSPHWEFVYIEGFEVDFDEAPYVFEPRGTVAFPEHITIKSIEEGCERESGINGYKFVIGEVGRTLDFVTEIGSKDVDISIPVPAFFIKDENGEWNSDMPVPVWHADLPDVIDLAVPHHKITLYMDDVFSDSGDSERKEEYRRNIGDDHIVCDITRFKSYLSGDDFAKKLKMRFGDVDTNLFTIIVHSKVVSLQILGDFDANDIIVNADISGKADYFVDIRKDGEVVAEKIQLINGSARLHHEIRNGIYEVEAFELVEDDSGFGGEDYYSIGIYEQEMMNPYDMTDRSFSIIQIEDRNNPQLVLPLRFNYHVLDLKKTDDNHTYNGMMIVRKRFFKGSEIAALPVSVKFEDLNKPNYVWISFVDEYGDDTDFLYDTRRQGILQEENMYLKPLVCYRRYTSLDSEEHVYHIDFIQEHYSSDYDKLDEFIEFPENESKIVFRDNRYDSQRKRFEVKGREGRGNIRYSTSIIFVGDAPLSAKSKMCLRDARINTLNDLTKLTKAELAARTSLATIKVFRDIDNVLAQYGMKFKDMEGDN